MGIDININIVSTLINKFKKGTILHFCYYYFEFYVKIIRMLAIGSYTKNVLNRKLALKNAIIQ